MVGNRGNFPNIRCSRRKRLVEYIVEDIHNGVRGGFSKVRLTNTGLNTIADLPEKIDTPETDVFIPIE
jgi:hypothetical protein